MNLLYSNEKLIKNKLVFKRKKLPPIRQISPKYPETSCHVSHASGDGDHAKCCRLCGGQCGLKGVRDSFVWEGVEQRYDELMYDCFGVTPSDCMICEWCVRALRCTERFRELIHAAFDQTASTSEIATEVASSTTKTNSCISPLRDLRKGLINTVQLRKSPLDVARRPAAKRKWTNGDMKSKRIIVQCEICRQRYPMMVSDDKQKTYTCSRCRKTLGSHSTVCKRCNIAMPSALMKDHQDLHFKANLRRKTRSKS
ncbi:uncharacterized protein LOC142985249 isoform X2 [Anticarsia gemmatalis]|uniref:uncharacterized protein LOC142985249 isoform X2 n=1 Tax=Anticarsia gemmatalis TaxID=129554 RepID=UPI003F76F0E0